MTKSELVKALADYPDAQEVGIMLPSTGPDFHRFLELSVVHDAEIPYLLIEAGD